MELFAELWEQGWHRRVETIRSARMADLLECIEIAYAGQNAGADAIARECIRELRRRV